MMLNFDIKNAANDYELYPSSLDSKRIEQAFSKLRILEQKFKNQKKEYSQNISTILNSLSEDLKCGKANEEDMQMVIDVINKWFREWLSIMGGQKIEKVEDFGFIKFD